MWLGGGQDRGLGSATGIVPACGLAVVIEVNQATIARFEDGIAWPRQPEEVLMAYASVLDMDVRLLWLHAFVLWLQNEPVLDKQSQEQIRAALKRLKI